MTCTERIGIRDLDCLPPPPPPLEHCRSQSCFLLGMTDGTVSHVMRNKGSKVGNAPGKNRRRALSLYFIHGATRFNFLPLRGPRNQKEMEGSENDNALSPISSPESSLPFSSGTGKGETLGYGFSKRYYIGYRYSMHSWTGNWILYQLKEITLLVGQSVTSLN